MRTLATYLWKEWRDQRTPVVVFPLAIAPVIALGVALMPATGAKNPSLPTLVMFGALAIAGLTLLADLIPGEEQRGTIRLLQRLPGGLLRAFLAKLAFGLLATLSFCAAAYLWTTIASALRGGPWFPAIDLGKVVRRAYGSTTFVEWWPLLLLVVAWIVTVSAWVPRGALALPAALFLLAGLIAPAVLWFGARSYQHPPTRDIVAAWWGLLAAAPIVAGVSFVVGRRRGGGIGASARIGLLATVVLVGPGYARVAVLVDRLDRLDPSDDSFRISSSYGEGFVASDGRHAFVTVHHRFDSGGPTHALAIDLEDGSWKELGRAGDEFNSIGMLSSRNAAPFIALRPTSIHGRGFAGRADDYSEVERWVVIDTATLAITARARRSDLSDPFRGTEEAAEYERAMNSVQLADGRRVWRRGNELVTDADHGSVRVLPDSQLKSAGLGSSMGLGFRIWEKGPGSFYDATRERRYPASDDVLVWYVRSGRWLVERMFEKKRGRVMNLFDPDTREFMPLPEAIAKLHYFGIAADGRLLALDRSPEALQRRCTLVLVDPESGATDALELPSWFGGRVQNVSIEGRTPLGSPVLSLTPGSGRCHARLDVTANRLVPAGGSDQGWTELLGCPDEETLILMKGPRQLVRARFGSPDFELVFPKPQAERR